MTQQTTTGAPPMDPGTDEATQHQLDLARAQGDAYGRALEHMTGRVADDGGEQRYGEYLIGYAIEKAEGMYEYDDGDLVWREPGQANLHVEVSVRDAGDGRFVPGVTVQVTLIGPDGNGVGPYDHPLLWHPMMYHYGRNWELATDGAYTMRVRVEPPQFMRHDRVNGRRFIDPVEVEFTGVQVERGQG